MVQTDDLLRLLDPQGGGKFIAYEEPVSTFDTRYVVVGERFYPRRLNQAAEPGAGLGATQIDTGELLIWRDSDDGKIYIVYNDADTGIVSAEIV